MYNKVKIATFVIVFFVFSLFSTTYAQSDSSSEEAIISFFSTIKVNLDSSVDVDEVITYTTGPVEHHGIYRDVRTVSSTEGKMKILNVKVVDENGNPYNFVFSNSGDFVRIKIGDANVTFSGQKIYHIFYHATNAVASLKDVDEIYWNATGNEWGMPIYEAKVTIILPDGLISNQNACYFGPKSSTDKCQLNLSSTSTSYIFDSPRILNSGEGLTVAVGFPKGTVIPYQESFADKYGILFGFIVFVLAVFFVMFTYWFNNWRDPKGRGIIVPQYDVPDGLTPMEVDGIVNEGINSKSISAEIIYLATLGYIKIKQVEDVTLGIFKSTDYQLTYLNYTTDNLNNFDKIVLTSIFTNIDPSSGGYSGTIILSNLKNHFYKKIPSIIKSISDSLLDKMYYKNLGKIGKNYSIPLIIFMSVWASLFFGPMISIFIPASVMFPVTMGIFFSFVIFGVFWYLSPAKTEKGVATKEYLLGLKEYLQIAEKDRLAFHNAPEKKPEVFEKLLPYAMIFGVDKAWAKEFENIYTTPPDWYEGAPGTHFSAITFGNSLSNFSSASSNTLSSTPGSSGGGSGGGGSSGGGGGGGGGGSW